MRLALAICALAALACACQPAPKTAPSDQTKQGTSQDAAIPPPGTFLIVENPGKPGTVTLTFGPGQMIEASLIGPVGDGLVMPELGLDPVPVSNVLDVPGPGTPVLGYKVLSEHGWTMGDPLCGGKPATALAFSQPETGPGKLAAITGDLPGEPGALVCNVRSVSAQR